MNPQEFIQLGGALTAALVGLAIAYQRYGVLRAKDKTVTAGELAIQAQFKILQEAIESNRREAAVARAEAAEARREATLARSETAELRHEQTRTDAVMHKQQRTLTRMESLLRQFSNFTQEKGLDVPPHWRDELDSLLIDNETLALRLKPVPPEGKENG